MKVRPRSGFTMLETVVAIAVSAIAFGFLAQAAQRSVDSFRQTMTLGRMDEAALRSIRVLLSELRWADPGGLLITNVAGEIQVDFRQAEDSVAGATVWSSLITISYEPLGRDLDGNGAFDEGRLVRLQDGRRTVLCSPVRAGSFQVVRNDSEVQVSLTVIGVDSERSVQEVDAGSAITLVNPDPF